MIARMTLKEILAAAATLNLASVKISADGDELLISRNLLADMLRDTEKAQAEIARLREENARLHKFARVVIDEHKHYLADVDGGTVQDAAVEAGLLVEATVTKPCGDGCVCVDYGFPTTCVRWATPPEQATTEVK